MLDGAGIESAEQAVAKERYAGRLTVDALVEKVGHNFWEHVRELDLSRSKIRELEGLQGAEFVNLRELNLDSNLLRSSPLYLPYTSPISPLYLQVYAGSARRGRAEVTGGHVFELQLLQRALMQVVVAGISEISPLSRLYLPHISRISPR